MKAIKLICELDKKWENGYYVIGQKRFPGEKFEVIDPNEGQILNIKRSCKVTESEIDIEEVVNPEESSDASAELLEFANDLWNLAVDLQKKIAVLENKDVKKQPSRKKKQKKEE